MGYPEQQSVEYCGNLQHDFKGRKEKKWKFGQEIGHLSEVHNRDMRLSL